MFIVSMLFVNAARHNFLFSMFFTLSARLSHHSSVRPSLRLSHWWISQKQCKIELPNLHCWLPGRL